LDKTITVKLSDVNDDYCDCPDGSDEPGTRRRRRRTADRKLTVCGRNVGVCQWGVLLHQRPV